MKTIKSLLLGSVVAIVAIASAQAADLPVKAKAVEYVKVCSLYGAGFYYIPGTDTCLKVGSSYLRADYYMNNAQGGGFTNLGTYNRAFNYFGTRARAAISLDARSQTAYWHAALLCSVRHQFEQFGPHHQCLYPARLHSVRGLHLR